MPKLVVFFSFWLFSSLSLGTVHITAVGDVLLHGPLQREGLKKGFSTLWLSVIPQLKQADITYGNLEGPAAEMLDSYGKITKNWNQAYTSFPMFNYPPSLLASLKLSGFDVLSTANNHTLDRWPRGVDKTIEALKVNKLAFTGTRRRKEQDPWFAETKMKDISIAWIACTQDTNGISDDHRQVLHCYRDKQQVLNIIKDLTQKYDAVIVAPTGELSISFTRIRHNSIWPRSLPPQGP